MSIRILSYLICFVIFLCACTQTEYNKKPNSQKGLNLRIEQEYENVKSLANAVRAGVIDSCQNMGTLAFEEMIKITPKMYQMVKHGAYSDKTCHFVNNVLGDLGEWNLVEAFKSKDRLLKIFRYKLISKKYDFPIELRITFTDQNKLTEFKFYKWEEVYSEDLTKMNWN